MVKQERIALVFFASFFVLNIATRYCPFYSWPDILVILVEKANQCFTAIVKFYNSVGFIMTVPSTADDGYGDLNKTDIITKTCDGIWGTCILHVKWKEKRLISVFYIHLNFTLLNQNIFNLDIFINR